MLYKIKEDVLPRGENGETEIGGLATRGTYVDGRFRKWVHRIQGWAGETYAWNALVISGPWAGAVMYFGATALQLVNDQDESVRYGMVESGNAVSMKRCPHCSEPAALHVLRQDGNSWGSVLVLREAIKRAQTDFQYFYRAVSNAKGKMPNLRGKFMVGVLITKKQECWAAHSGGKDEANIRAIVEKILGWNFAGMDAVITEQILNKRHELATNGRIPNTVQSLDY